MTNKACLPRWCLFAILIMCCSMTGFCRRTRLETYSCSASRLGYYCSTEVCGGIVIHWSLGGLGPDLGTCSSLVRTEPGARVEPDPQVLHMAIEAPSATWVGIGFAQKAGRVLPANGVIGQVFKNDGPAVSSYDIKPASEGGVHLSNTLTLTQVAAMREPNNSMLYCFTRNLEEGLGLRPLDMPLQLNVAKGIHPTLAHHPHDNDHQCGAIINAITGTTKLVFVDYRPWIDTHGCLMVIVWLFLVPLAVLLARYRHILEASPPSLWFHVHRGLAALSVLMMLGAMMVAWIKFFESEPNTLKLSHKVLGYLLLALVPAQVLGTFIRPAPDSPKRPLWNKVHFTLGRLAILLGMTNVGLGIASYRKTFAVDVATWVASSTILGVVMVVVAVLLEVAKRKLAAAEVLGFPKDHLAHAVAHVRLIRAGSSGGHHGGGARKASRLGRDKDKEAPAVNINRQRTARFTM